MDATIAHFSNSAPLATPLPSQAPVSSFCVARGALPRPAAHSLIAAVFISEIIRALPRVNSLPGRGPPWHVSPRENY